VEDEQKDPDAGKWSDKKQSIICEGEGDYGTEELNNNWSKNDLCRDHGNGLEVVCLEKYYQDVREDLPKPDLAVMFSPGFPQFQRRSWDTVLIGLLNSRIPIVVSDVVTLGSWGYKLHLPRVSDKPIAPGSRWKSRARIGENWQTWMTMQKYKAAKITARRNPFPILHKEDGGILAKNAVIQIYEGYKPNAKPTQQLSLQRIRKFQEQFKRVNWTDVGHKGCKGIDDPGGAIGVTELRHGYKYPTSRAFDDAVRDLYKDGIREQVHHFQTSELTDGERAALREYGLLRNDRNKYRRVHWGLDDWVSIARILGCLEGG
jgi:hypothetical protein